MAIVGEFKRGKSTLVNALLQTAVCPVDADEVTVVPTIVRYGETAGATAYLEASGPRRRAADRAGADRLRSPTGCPRPGNPGNRRGLRSVEVRLPRRILRAGLCLVDTPGVGGLDSAHGIITLGALDQADGMLFVTDAVAGADRTGTGLPAAGPGPLPAGGLRDDQDRPVPGVAADRRDQRGAPARAPVWTCR